MHYLGNLLHLCDSTLPIGAYSHSSGLETYVQLNLVHSTLSAKAFIFEFFEANFKANDAAYMHLAYQAAHTNNLHDLILLDQEMTATKAPKEIRTASQKLGTRLIKIFQRNVRSALIDSIEEEIKEKRMQGHYPIIFSIYAQALEIPLTEALLAFYYNAAVGLVTNSVKLIPLGQLDGQGILFELNKVIPKLVEETLVLPRALVGTCSTGLDIRSMQHEHLYSRLYMS